MFACRRVLGLSLICLVFSITGCTTPQGLDSVQVTPGAQSLAVGQTVQFTATGTYGNAKHPSTQNITSVVTWTSSTPSVATVNTSGVATAVGAGTTTITASAAAFNGPTTSSATLTVTGSSGGGTAGGSIASLADHSRHSIGGVADSDEPIPRHRNDFIGGNGEPDQSGGMEFKQHANCHDRRYHRPCHGGGSGNHHDYRNLYQYQWRNRGDRDRDVQRDGRND